MATQGPVTPINSSQYFGLTPAPPKSELDMQTFLRLLTSQLQNQDPMNPVSNSDFAAQLAQLGTVQGMQNLQNAASVQQAAAVMGKHVIAIRPFSGGSLTSAPVDGTVTRLTIKNGVYYLGVTEANGGIVDIQSSAIKQIDNG